MFLVNFHNVILPRNIISEKAYFFLCKNYPEQQNEYNDRFKDSAVLLFKTVMTQVGKPLSINRTIPKTFVPHFESFKDFQKIFIMAHFGLSLCCCFFRNKSKTNMRTIRSLQLLNYTNWVHLRNLLGWLHDLVPRHWSKSNQGCSDPWISIKFFIYKILAQLWNQILYLHDT